MEKLKKKIFAGAVIFFLYIIIAPPIIKYKRESVKELNEMSCLKYAIYLYYSSEKSIPSSWRLLEEKGIIEITQNKKAVLDFEDENITDLEIENISEYLINSSFEIKNIIVRQGKLYDKSSGEYIFIIKKASSSYLSEAVNNSINISLYNQLKGVGL